MKKLIFSFLATVFMSLMSVSAQQSTPKDFTSLKDASFGRISSYAGPCVEGGGVCSGTISPNSMNFEVAIIKSSENTVTYAIANDFYQQNIQFLKNGLVVSKSFSLPKILSEKIGFKDEFVVAKGDYQLEYKDNIYYLSLNRVR